MERDPAWSRQRLFSTLFGVFGGLALLLAMVGLYSVVSYSVTQRTGEFGIRMALGAQRRHVLWTAGRSILLTVASGLLLGATADLFLQKFLARWTQNNQHSPWIFMGVVLLFLVSSLLACLIPALRAASIDPMRALHYE